MKYLFFLAVFGGTFALGYFFGDAFLMAVSDAGVMPRAACWRVKGEILPYNYGAHFAIAAAYFGIGGRLTLVAHRRGKQIFTYETILYAAFIMLCGATHVTALLMFFYGVATLDTAILCVTAGVSLLACLRTFAVGSRIENAPSIEQVEAAKEKYLRAYRETMQTNFDAKEGLSKIAAATEKMNTAAVEVFALTDKIVDASLIGGAVKRNAGGE